MTPSPCVPVEKPTSPKPLKPAAWKKPPFWKPVVAVLTALNAAPLLLLAFTLCGAVNAFDVLSCGKTELSILMVPVVVIGLAVEVRPVPTEILVTVPPPLPDGVLGTYVIHSCAEWLVAVFLRESICTERVGVLGSAEIW